MKYEYEAEMEEIYRHNLLKSFKKQIDNLLFNFIIVDSCNEKVEFLKTFGATPNQRLPSLYCRNPGRTQYMLQEEYA